MEELDLLDDEISLPSKSLGNMGLFLEQRIEQNMAYELLGVLRQLDMYTPEVIPELATRIYPMDNLFQSWADEHIEIFTWMFFKGFFKDNYVVYPKHKKHKGTGDTKSTPFSPIEYLLMILNESICINKYKPEWLDYFRDDSNGFVNDHFHILISSINDKDFLRLLEEKLLLRKSSEKLAKVQDEKPAADKVTKQGKAIL